MNKWGSPTNIWGSLMKSLGSTINVLNDKLGVSDEIILWVSFKIWVPERSTPMYSNDY